MSIKTNPAELKDWQGRIIQNDQQAFTELFRHFYDRLHHFCIQYVHSPESAEEIVSDCFVSLWNRRSELGKVNNLEVYLFIAVKNRSLNHLQKYSGLRIVAMEGSGSATLVNTIDPEKQLEWKEMLAKMDNVVNALPEQCRRIFLLVKEEGFKSREAALILGISPRTVETQVLRAMRRLQDAIGKFLREKYLPIILIIFYGY